MGFEVDDDESEAFLSTTIEWWGEGRVRLLVFLTRAHTQAVDFSTPRTRLCVPPDPSIGTLHDGRVARTGLPSPATGGDGGEA